MSKEVSVRLVEHQTNEIVPFKTKDMKLRELCDRIYYLLQRCNSPSGRTLVQILAEVNNAHPQHLFEVIYQQIRKRYYQSQEPLAQKAKAPNYLLERDNEFFLARFEYLKEILVLFKLQENYREIPHYLRKRLSAKMIEQLYDDIPRLRILYIHRHNPSPYRHNTVETLEVLHRHYDGDPIPPFVKHLFIHRIFKFQGHTIKIWEIVPQDIKHPTPVCLLPGFGSNYYTFHYEGNNSLDYHLVKQGSHVFVLDHDWEEQDANIDIYAEYLLTTILDFIKRRTNLPQVILGGHGLGGTLIVFKSILDCLQRPHFITSIKAMILFNTPINFNANYFIPNWMAKAAELVVDTIGNKGVVPVGKLSRMASYLPGVTRFLTMESEKFKAITNWLGIDQHDPTLWWDTHLRVNPLTDDPKVLKFLMKKALTNPPRMVVKHLINMMASDIEGAASYQYQELFFEQEDEVADVEKDWENQEHGKKRTLGINYTAHLHRMSGAIPTLAFQTADDPLSPPTAFFRVWPRWPSQYKLRLDSYPDDFQNQEQVCQKISNFVKKFGLSSAVGITLHRGRHVDCLRTQKRLVSTFIQEVEQFAFSPVDLVKTELQLHRAFIENSEDLSQKLEAERDLAKKLRFLDIHFFWAEQREMLRLFLDLIVTRPPLHPADQRYTDFMTRNTKAIEENEALKYDMLYCCVSTILAFEPDPETLIQQLLKILHVHKDQLAPESFRSLIDLSVSLYDASVASGQAPSPLFLERFEDMLQFSIAQKDRSIALHALRGFLHTRNPYFIKKGSQIYQNLPKEWKELSYYIYWNEINKLISEFGQQQGGSYLESMSAFIEIYDQLQPETLGIR